VPAGAFELDSAKAHRSLMLAGQRQAHDDHELTACVDHHLLE
jgi:hypothetical protein